MPVVARWETQMNEGVGMRHWGVAGGGVCEDYLNCSQKLLAISDRNNTTMKRVAYIC